MRLAKRLLLSAVLALTMTVGLAAPGYAESAESKIVEVQQCPQGYEGVIVIVYLFGQPNGVVVCQNILP